MPGLFSAPFGLGGFNETVLDDSVPLWFLANLARQRQKPHEDRAFAAFGRFIASYALAEAGLHIAVRFFSGMTDKKARKVFSGSRNKDIIIVLRHFVSETDKSTDIEDILSHLNKITEARNQFVHRLIVYDPQKGLCVTNHLTSETGEIQEPKIFIVSDLDAMAHDCRLMFGRLVLHCDKTEELKHVGEFTLLGLYAPWQYKPLPPDTPDQPNRHEQKSSKRPSRASRPSQSDQPSE
jgi:hypothetical protein